MLPHGRITDGMLILMPRRYAATYAFRVATPLAAAIAAFSMLLICHYCRYLPPPLRHDIA